MKWARLRRSTSAYGAARAEERRLRVGEQVHGRSMVSPSARTYRAGHYSVPRSVVWRRGPYRPDYGVRRHQEGGMRGHHSRGVPGGGVAYRAGVRALHALEQDGAFAPPSPPPPARRQRGKATHLPRTSHTALAGHCRPAMTVPDRRRPAGGCPAWHLSLGGCRLPETPGGCAPVRFLAVCLHGVCLAPLCSGFAVCGRETPGCRRVGVHPDHGRTLRAPWCGHPGVDHDGTGPASALRALWHRRYRAEDDRPRNRPLLRLWLRRGRRTGR
jgi:hypothetical protein